MEDDLILVKYRDGSPEKSDPTYITTYFEKNDTDEWFPKPYEFHCEFCGKIIDCDRVTYQEDLHGDVEYCMMWGETNPEVSNNDKRQYIYRVHTYNKHGRLGSGNRVRPAACVLKFVR